jgi:hypothetical protein
MKGLPDDGGAPFIGIWFPFFSRTVPAIPWLIIDEAVFFADEQAIWKTAGKIRKKRFRFIHRFE